MCKSSRPSQRRREQLDSLHWAGRAKALGLPPDKVRKQAQLDAEAVARVTARITQGTVNERRPKPFFEDTPLDLWYRTRISAERMNRELAGVPAGQLTVKRPARYVNGSGKQPYILIVDDLDLKVQLS